jgi:periplasmic divalent cation tolerance protein
MSQALVVLTTTPNRDEADRIAAALVERQLAACVQIVGPIGSVYRWKGQVEQSQEWLCLIKTDEPHYEELEAAIHDLHSYDVPEVVALPIAGGSAPYLDWLAASLTQ